MQEAKDLLKESIALMDQRCARHQTLTGLSTGYADLDCVTQGLRGGSVTVVAGRPCIGSTQFCFNLMRHILLDNHLGVVLFSTQLASSMAVGRLLTLAAKVEARKIRTGSMTSEDWTNVNAVMAELHDCEFYIEDSPSLTVDGVRRQLIALQDDDKNIEAVFIDSLEDLIANTRCFGEASQQSEHPMIALKALAEEFGVALVGTAPIPRKLEKRKNKRPRLTDLRLADYADIVLFIYRDSYYKWKKQQDFSTEIIVARNRWGPLGAITLDLDVSTGIFSNQTLRTPNFDIAK